MKHTHHVYTLFIYLVCIYSSVIVCQQGPLRVMHQPIVNGKLKPGEFEFTGYIMHEAFWDSHQVNGSSEDTSLNFPDMQHYDARGFNINAKGQYVMVPIETNCRLEFGGPKIGDAKSHVAIEADFFGFTEFITNLDFGSILRMRLAFIHLSWKHSAILAGQFWHPMYIPECFADTISYNSGQPIDLYARVPQVRHTYVRGDRLEIILCAATELDCPSLGPIGASTTYIRNALVPNLHMQIKTRIRNHFFGCGVDYKRLVPRLVTNKDVKTSTALNSFAILAYAAFNWNTFSMHTKLMYGGNLTDYGGLGGYAVHSVQPSTDIRTYTNLRNISFWIDSAIKKYHTVEPGLFIGVDKNLGAPKTIIQNITDANGIKENTIYSFGADIDILFRISPRLRYVIKKFTIGLELEYTRASFGTITSDGTVTNAKPTSNTRLLLALYYDF